MPQRPCVPHRPRTVFVVHQKRKGQGQRCRVVRGRATRWRGGEGTGERVPVLHTAQPRCQVAHGSRFVHGRACQTLKHQRDKWLADEQCGRAAVVHPAQTPATGGLVQPLAAQQVETPTELLPLLNASAHQLCNRVGPVDGKQTVKRSCVYPVGHRPPDGTAVR